MYEVEEYHVLTLADPDQLEHAINRAIGEGYQPLGGISIGIMRMVNSDNEEIDVSMFSQAIVKFKSAIQRLN